MFHLESKHDCQKDYDSTHVSWLCSVRTQRQKVYKRYTDPDVGTLFNPVLSHDMRNVDYCDFYLNTAGNVHITNCLEELSTDLRCLIILQKYSLHIEYSVKVHLKWISCYWCMSSNLFLMLCYCVLCMYFSFYDKMSACLFSFVLYSGLSC